MGMRLLNAGSVEFMFPRKYELEVCTSGTVIMLERGGCLPIHNAAEGSTVRIVPVAEDSTLVGIGFELPENGGVPVLTADGVSQTVARVPEETGLHWLICG